MACRWLRRPLAPLPHLLAAYTRGVHSGALPPDVAALERIIMGRRACRKFDAARPIDVDVLAHILSLTQRAPSGFNMQPWRAVIVQSSEAKRRLSQAMLGAANVERVLAAPVTLVFAADLQPAQALPDVVALERAAGKPPAYLKAMQETVPLLTSTGALCPTLAGDAEQGLKARLTSLGSVFTPLPTINSAEAWAFKSTSLACMSYMLAASAWGLATAPMEGFDGRRVAAAVGIGGGARAGAACGAASRWSVPMVIPTGYEEGFDSGSASTRPPSSPRLPLSSVFRLDTWDTPLDLQPLLGGRGSVDAEQQ